MLTQIEKQIYDQLEIRKNDEELRAMGIDFSKIVH